MQVFFNIISNALEAMEAAKGGVLTIKTIRDRGNVVILFSDTGPGLKEPHRVFDPFYTTKPVGKGTGLGLSICFGIIQEHGGKILSYNRQEGGAVFRVELPAVLAALPSKGIAAKRGLNAISKTILTAVQHSVIFCSPCPTINITHVRVLHSILEAPNGESQCRK